MKIASLLIASLFCFAAPDASLANDRIMLLIEDYSSDTWTRKEADILNLETIQFQALRNPVYYYGAVATLQVDTFDIGGVAFRVRCQFRLGSGALSQVHCRHDLMGQDAGPIRDKLVQTFSRIYGDPVAREGSSITWHHVDTEICLTTLDYPPSDNSIIVTYRGKSSDTSSPTAVAAPTGNVDKALDRLQEKAENMYASLVSIYESVDRSQISAAEKQKLDEALVEAKRSSDRIYQRGHMHLMMRALRYYLSEGVPYRTGTGQLSWRVHLLPFIGEIVLYRKFRLDEDWDSPHNIQLLDQMPRLYRQRGEGHDPSNTRFLAVDGPEYLCRNGRLSPLSDVTDSESDTIAICVVSESLAQPWTMPNDLRITRDTYESVMKDMPTPEYFYGTIEGAALQMPPEFSFELFHAAATIAGGEEDAGRRITKEKFRLWKLRRK